MADVNLVSTKEVVSEFNTRSETGRVVVKPPHLMEPLRLRETLPVYFCCGIAFLSEESFENHNASVEAHGNPINLANVQTSRYDRSSIQFWRTRKVKAALSVEDSDYEDGEDDDDEQDDHGSEHKREPTIDSDDDEASQCQPQQYLQTPSTSTDPPRRFTPDGKPYKQCTLCKMWMPGTNLTRHVRTCHDPINQFACRYCCCKLSGAYGRMVHEVKVHKVASTLSTTKRLKTLVTTHQKKLLKLPLLSQKPKGFVPISKRFCKLASGWYQCNVCLKKFTNRPSARDHMNSHTGTKPHKCPKCHFRFTHKSNINRHMRACHVEDGEFPCHFKCGCVMSHQRSLNVHMQICKGMGGPLIKKVKKEPAEPGIVPPKPSEVHINRSEHSELADEIKKSQVGPALYHCKKCNKNITSSANFRDHLNSHAGVRPHKCPQCYMTFTFKCNIKRHVQTCHVKNGRFKCPMKCGCVMSAKKCLQSHLISCKRKLTGNGSKLATTQKTKRMPLPIKIKIEPASPRAESNLPRRFQNLPALKPKPSSLPSGKFQCEICGNYMSCARNLRNHMLIHLNLKPYKCELCGVSFRAGDSLKKHQERSHVPTGAFRCPLCPCQFRESQGLTMHTKMYHTKNWKRGTPAIRVANNKSSQIPLKPMPKLIKAPTHLNGLTKDETVHQNYNLVPGELANRSHYKCKTCGKVLQSAITLKNHRLIHTGEKPFECNDCGCKFRLGSTLFEHKKNSHGRGSYACDKCTCRFESDLGLSRHYRFYHEGMYSKMALKNKIHDIKRRALGLTTGTKMTSSSQKISGLRRKQISTSTSRPEPPRKQPIRLPSVKVEPNPDAVFTCGDCGLAYETLQALSDHQREHTKREVEDPPEYEEYQEMPLLIEMETDDDYLDTAKLGTSQNKSNWPIPCRLCGTRIYGDKHKRRHNESCHGQGAFNCTACDCCRFNSNHAMVCHVSRCHANVNGSNPISLQNNEIKVEKNSELDLQPKIVGKQRLPKARPKPKSKSAALLKKMKRVQISKKNSVACEICGKLYRDGWTLNQHMLTHSNSKPFKCPTCHQGFRTTNILATHTKTSHGNGNFHCPRCPSRFETPKGLSVHQFVFHKGGRLSKYGPGFRNGLVAQKNAADDSKINTDVRTTPPIPLNRGRVKAHSSPVKRVPTHLKRSSPKDKPMQCKICNFKCIGLTKYREHTMNHTLHDEGDGELSSAEEMFNNLNQHAMLLDIDREFFPNNKIVYEAGEDDEVEEDFGQQNPHIDNGQSLDDNAEEIEDDEADAEHEGANYTCEEIEIEEDSDDRNLHDDEVLHYDDEMDDQFVDCQGCGLSFSSKAQFLYHIQVGASEEDMDNPYRCTLCCVAETSEESLQGHYELYHSQEETEFVESHVLS